MEDKHRSTDTGYLCRQRQRPRRQCTSYLVYVQSLNSKGQETAIAAEPDS